MPSQTTYYNLWLYNNTTDSTEYAQNFRLNMAGTTVTSNMNKIDTAMYNLQTQISGLQNRASIIPVSATASSPSNYVATSLEIDSYLTDIYISLKLDTSSSGSTTLNINGLGIKSLQKYNESGSLVNITDNELRLGKEYIFRYNGSVWVWVAATSADQISITGTVGNLVKIGTGNILVDSGIPSGAASGAPKTAKYVTTETNVDLTNAVVIPNLAASPNGINNKANNGQSGLYPPDGYSKDLVNRLDFDTDPSFTWSPSVPNIGYGINLLKSYYVACAQGTERTALKTLGTSFSGAFELRGGGMSLGSQENGGAIFGLLLSDNAGTNMLRISLDVTTGATPRYIRSHYYTSSTWTVIGYDWEYGETYPTWLRLVRDGSNKIRPSFSYDGFNFMDMVINGVYPTITTTYTKIGLYFYQYTGVSNTGIIDWMAWGT